MKISNDLAELMDETHYLAPVTASTIVECFTEWAMRHLTDDTAEQAGQLPAGHTRALEVYMQAAYRQCIDQGLLPEWWDPHE